MHSTSVCQPLAGLKAHAAEVALAQGVPGTVTPHAPGSVSHHNKTHLTLQAQPAAWHQIHGFWQFVTSLKIKGITRLLEIHLWHILVKFKNSERYHSGLFIPPFIFSTLLLLCQSYCCFAHIFDGLSHLLYTYMHVCSHTYKPTPMQLKD